MKKMKDIESLVYSKMCSGCLSERKCHEECTHCDEFYEELSKAQATKKTKRYKQLTDIEKTAIYADFNSGKYYIKEIMERYRITKYVLRRVVNELKNELRRTTTYL